MKDQWPVVSLGEVLTPISRSESVDPEKTYHILGAHWYAEGLYTKETTKGSLIRASRVYRIEKGDFVYNRLFAWKGSFAVATEENHGCYVSNEFPAFEINRYCLDPQYLWRYFCRASIWEEALGLSTGGTPTSRNRLKEGKLLAMDIPLPPLDEQRCIVARIEELAARIEEARELRRRAVEETEALLKSGIKDLFAFENINFKSIHQLAKLRGGGTPSKSNPQYWEGNVPWISPKDMKRKEIIDSLDHISVIATQESSAKLLDPGSILIVVRGMILARMVPTAILRVPAAINQDMKALIPGKDILPEYLSGALWAFNDQILELVEKSTHDTRKLETFKILDFRIPVPSLDQQQIIVYRLNEMQSRLDVLKRHQAEIVSELSALIPSILDKAFRGDL